MKREAKVSLKWNVKMLSVLSQPLELLTSTTQGHFLPMGLWFYTMNKQLSGFFGILRVKCLHARTFVPTANAPSNGSAPVVQSDHSWGRFQVTGHHVVVHCKLRNGLSFVRPDILPGNPQFSERRESSVVLCSCFEPNVLQIIIVLYHLISV